MKITMTVVIIRKIIRYIRQRIKTVVGKFKDEMAGQSVVEFVGLRPKIYSFITINNDANKKG